MQKRLFFRFCTVCYATALFLWLVWGSVQANRVSRVKPIELSVQDAVLSSIRDDYPVNWGCWQTGSLLTTDGDAYLIWQPRTPVSGLEVQITSSQPVRGLQLYYTLPGEPDFIHTVQPSSIDRETGTYRFRLPGTAAIERLRLDPTSAAGAFFRLDRIVLNPDYPLWQCWLPDLGQAVLLLAAPGIFGSVAAWLTLAVKSSKKER